MKSEGFNAYNKYIILKHGIKENNISKTCNLFGISRTTYYNWQRDYQKHGMKGLENREPKKPRMPNKVSKSTERKILDYVLKYPGDGPKRIYYEMKSEGINVGETGIYNVLKRNSLTRKKDRLEYAKNRGKYSRNSFKLNKEVANLANTLDAYPGYLIVQRIDYIGTFAGIGKIYQYSFYDTISRWGEVKVFNKKQDIDIWNYFEMKFLYLLNTFNLTIENLVTEKDKEFLPFFIKDDRYSEIINRYEINHIFTSQEDNIIFEDMNDFNEILVTEFYNRIGIDENLDSFIKIEHSINAFVRDYNFTREISDGDDIGKKPVEAMLQRAVENNVDLDTLPLWILALISSAKWGEKDERE